VGKLLVLASGVVKASGAPRAVSAYVVLSAGAASRVFRVRGAASAPSVEELPSATTLDIKRFQTELDEDLQPTLRAARAADGKAHIELSRPEWVCACVRKHLKATEGLDVD
jgi:hypothetical protein